MKKYILILSLALVSLSCNGQNPKEEENQIKTTETPKGTWKVDKEFDENGNLIRYDSIYTWSSSTNYDKLSSIEKDSLLANFESKFFKNFSNLKQDSFEDLFTPDSLFTKHFFNNNFFENDFGKEFSELIKMKEQMIENQKEFLKKYQSEYNASGN
ncbi:hypothetical protein [Lacinutrix salivirga]